MNALSKTQPWMSNRLCLRLPQIALLVLLGVTVAASAQDVSSAASTSSESVQSAPDTNVSVSNSGVVITKDGREVVRVGPSGIQISPEAQSQSGASSRSEMFNESLQSERRFRRQRWSGSDNDRVSIGGSIELPAGETSDNVVAVGGNANVAGEVKDAVVAIMGNTRVTGIVGDSVVTIMGNSYINNAVRGDVVTLMGRVELGPQAVVDGELVTIAGTVIRDPAAVVNRMNSVGTMPAGVNFGWFKSWVTRCVLYGRLLAFDASLTWAWIVAGIALLLYVLTASLVPKTVAHCVQVLEQSPGKSLLAALLSIVLIPAVFLLLVITLVGIIAVPFVGLALMTAAWFGKLIMLAWLGKRLLQLFKPADATQSVAAYWALATVVGGLVVTLLYTIPVVGFIAYKGLQFVGFGVVLYVLLLMFQKPRVKPAPAEQFSAHEPVLQTTSAAVEGGQPASRTDQNGFTQSASATNTPPDTVSATPDYAGFWPRMGALAIDVVLIGALVNVLNLPGMIRHPMLIALALYGVLMWKLKGTTVGGIVFHLHVVRTDGRALDWPTSIVRGLSCFLSLIVAGLGFIWIAFDDDKQAWHDKIAGTVVLRTPKGTSLV